VKAYFQRMFRYVAWANRRTLEALQNGPAANAEGLPLMAHILAAEHLWLHRLLEQPTRHPVWPMLNLEECATLLNENETGYREFLNRLSEEQFNQVIGYRTTQGQECHSTILEMLTQVVTHGPYHRGQIAKALARNGAVAVNTDFIIFTREGE
jgi:uncharacterized damage-inducible protein DinB